MRARVQGQPKRTQGASGSALSRPGLPPTAAQLTEAGGRRPSRSQPEGKGESKSSFSQHTSTAQHRAREGGHNKKGHATGPPFLISKSPSSKVRFIHPTTLEARKESRMSKSSRAADTRARACFPRQRRCHVTTGNAGSPKLCQRSHHTRGGPPRLWNNHYYNARGSQRRARRGRRLRASAATRAHENTSCACCGSFETLNSHTPFCLCVCREMFLARER